jgi:hypothetical protein
MLKRTKIMLAASGLSLAALLPAMASAADLSIGVNLGGYVPAPVYYDPPPPPPPAAVYYGPAPVVYGGYYGDGWREHEWREHEWREHEWHEHEWREHHEGWR